MGRRASAAAPARKRPYPPEAFDGFIPAPEVLAWIQQEILAESGSLHNPDHKHLRDADLAVLWAHDGFSSKGRFVVGTAEELAFRCSRWQKERQELQMVQWFGRVPDYLITLDATYASQASDVQWCALVEHELYHVAHKLDPFGAPMFTKEGQPKLEIRGHDVEEFVGVVRRYGVGLPEGRLAQLVAAAKKGPEVAQATIAGACGTCMLRVA